MQAAHCRHDIPGWIACVLLCACAILFFGCSDEQGAAYKKAETLLHTNTISNGKEAALLFESLGEYKDAAQRSKECWFNYGLNRLRYQVDSLQERLVLLQEAKSVFAHINGYKSAAKFAAEADAAIATTQAWIAVQTAQDAGDDKGAMALLEAMDPKDKKVLDTLEFIRTKDERERRLALLQEYLDRLPQSTFVIDKKQSFHANLDRLLMSDAFGGSHEKTADVLAATRCYDSIARAWNQEFFYATKRRLSFEGGLLQKRLTKKELFLALLKLAETGDESPEFAELLALLRGAVIPSVMGRPDPDLARYAKLLELYNGGEEWVDKFFPGNSALLNCKIPGTVEYRVLHAPQRFKDVLYNETTDVLHDRFTQEYSALKAKELFANFVPGKPLKTGFIVIIDRGTPPPYTSDGQIFNYLAYESPTKHVTVSYEREIKPSQQKDDIKGVKGVKVAPPEEPHLIEQIEQKGEYFCVANPNNARLAIYETYSYHRYGSYRVSGRQDLVDVYLPEIDIAVVDLVAKKTLFTDKITLNSKQTYRVPANIKQGDAYIPLISFDKQRYLSEKLDSVLKQVRAGKNRDMDNAAHRGK
ncbi:hypothetical protein FACS1894158_10720 [Betaproteobacteria bacterium]|nr:hypothetical protein FACS1894158_10720 [Betaproteobacteria bacterium]